MTCPTFLGHGALRRDKALPYGRGRGSNTATLPLPLQFLPSLRRLFWGREITSTRVLKTEGRGKSSTLFFFKCRAAGWALHYNPSPIHMAIVKVPVKNYMWAQILYVRTIFQTYCSYIHLIKILRVLPGEMSVICFFFLRDKHTTFYGRLRVLYVSTIW